MDYFKDSGQFGAKLLMHHDCVEKTQKENNVQCKLKLFNFSCYGSKRVAIGGKPDLTTFYKYINLKVYAHVCVLSRESIDLQNGDFLNENVRHNKSINKKKRVSRFYLKSVLQPEQR